MLAFDSFSTAVIDSFAFLKELGYEHVESREQLPEMWVSFRSGTTGVTVIYELGSTPWVQLSRLAPRGGDLVEGESSSLELLMDERSRRESVSDRGGTTPSELSDPELRVMLSKKAEELKRYAMDVLRGDFSVFPRLHERAEENERRENLKLFGNESGETRSRG